MKFTKDKLAVKVFENRKLMGKAAATDVADCIEQMLSEKKEINMIFAAAPSQNEFLEELAESGVEWERINAFHMDEYIGLPLDAEQRFGTFLKERIFGRVPFKSVHYINGQAQPEKECDRYSLLLKQYPVDIVCLGIGENGHIAFNDPHVAKFDDPELVKVVALDEKCRMQQVHDGCFAKLSDVPTHAITLTVPALMRAKFHFCMVPAASKCEAVYRTVHGPIGPECPASALRLCRHANLYVDRDSGAKLAEVLYD